MCSVGGVDQLVPQVGGHVGPVRVHLDHLGLGDLGLAFRGDGVGPQVALGLADHGRDRAAVARVRQASPS